MDTARINVPLYHNYKRSTIKGLSYVEIVYVSTARFIRMTDYNNWR
jgi:hypothetical protein